MRTLPFIIAVRDVLAAGLAVAILTAAPLTSVSIAAAQNLVPRAAAQQMTLQEMQALPASDRVVIKLREGQRVQLSDNQLKGLLRTEQSDFAATLFAVGIERPQMAPLFTRPSTMLDAERLDAESKSDRALADLNLYLVLDVPEGVSAAEVANRLNGLATVEFARPAPLPAPPPFDISPTTPDFSDQQGYKGSAPTGINQPSALLYPGVDGTDMAMVDIEYDWQLDHEDLELPADRHLVANAVNPFGSNDHGTAVLGEIVGEDNGYGVTGITPSAFAYVAAANTTSGFNPANAINIAAATLNAGDVIVLEQQYWACGSPTSTNIYGPIEWLQSVFDATSQATAKGVIVVAAAGNGPIDLDSSSCNNRFNRSIRDSGAIIVGAGASSDRSRKSFSSYGSRVDVQGWGDNVTTTGYGSLFSGGGDIRQRYTPGFNGTSSATPIVAGAVLAIQGRRKACGLPVATPGEIRATLVATGSPQNNPVSGKIGPLPNVLAAMKDMDLLECGDVGDPELLVTPAGRFLPKGPKGGPFRPFRKLYTLTNVGAGSMTWKALEKRAWLQMVPRKGVLEAGESVVIKAVITKHAKELAARFRPYKVKIFFKNSTNGTGNTARLVKLRVTRK